MRALLGLVAVFALILAVRLAGLGGMTGDIAADGLAGSQAALAAMALGFVLLVSFVLGGQVTRFGLPTVSGYILVGLLAGPYVLGRVHPLLAVLDHRAVAGLRLLDALALGLIALSAGGELKMESLRRHARTIAAVIAGQVGLVAVGVGALVVLGARWFPSLDGLTGGPLWGVGLLFGVIAAANSPATALAIVREYGSKGPVSEVVLAVTVAKDVVVISLFTLAFAVAGLLIVPGAVFSPAFLGTLLWEVGGSVAIGLLLGALMAVYVRKVGAEVPLLVLGVAFAAVTVLPAWHLSGLLALMVAGFYVENHSAQGDHLLRAVERHTLPVYVVFFTIAGASLDLGALRATLPLALSLALLRGALTVVGTALGAWLAGAPPTVLRHGWSGFIAQAGVTLGFAILVEQRLPGVGDTVRTVTLAVIALNQLAGPVLFRLGLLLAGEIPRPTAPDSADAAAGADGAAEEEGA